MSSIEACALDGAAERPGQPAGRRAAGAASVLHVTAPAPYGGLERVVGALTGGMEAAGRVARVVGLLTEGGPHAFLDGLEAVGVDTHRIVTGARDYRRQSAELTKLIRRVRPDVVHTHGYQADLLGGRAARRQGVPTVTTLHGFTGGGWKNRVYEWAQVRACRRFDGVVAVSRPIAARLAGAGVPADRIVCLPNAWSAAGDPLSAAAARSALGVHPGSFHVGWVGRMSREKGLDVLIEALAQLRDLPVVVSAVGDGPERSALERRSGELGVEGRIVWQGVRADAWRLYPGFDLFVLSSRTEGTPMVLFEAAAAGVPIVTTEVGGVPDVVTPAEAVLVPADEPVRLAAAIRSSHAHPEAAAERAAAARARVATQFAVAPWLDRYLELYDSLRS